MPSRLVCLVVFTLIHIVDVWRVAAKGAFIKQAGLAGFAMYDTGGDSNGILIGSITQAMA